MELDDAKRLKSQIQDMKLRVLQDMKAAYKKQQLELRRQKSIAEAVRAAAHRAQFATDNGYDIHSEVFNLIYDRTRYWVSTSSDEFGDHFEYEEGVVQAVIDAYVQDREMLR